MKKELLIKIIAVMVMIISIGKSSNAQSGWEEVHSIDGVFMRDICFVAGSDGAWQTGWAITYEGHIIKTTDGGDTWTEITQSHSSALGGISFADEDNGFIGTLDDKVLKSTDGGATWSVVFTDISGFDKIAFKDDQNGVVSGSYKHYTSDGGVTWTEGTGGSSYWDLDHAAGDTYYGINLGGSLGQSTDAGASWSDVENLGVFAFMVDFLDENTGMFGGDLSKIMVTQDGGSSWSTNTLGGGQDAINCGGFFDADTIYACGSSGEVFKSIDGGANWDTDTSFSAGVFQPRGFVVTGMNVLFSAANVAGGDGKIWRKIGAPPIGADFEASQTEVCAGSSVDFTDLSFGPIDSWSWEFEGGTPATSTDQNPTVTYSSTGFYDVKLVVTVGAFADSLIRTEYIEVVELPAQADMPEGDDAVCTNMVYEYTTNDVLFAKEYDWEIVPSGAGILEADGTTASLTVDEDFTGDFTIRVRASNVCGDGDWSDNLEGTVYLSPTAYTLEGGGGYCLDGEGVEITLSGSDTDIDYELFMDGESTGIIVEGTGSEISFGLLTDEGYYTAKGSNDNCTQIMNEQIQVFILFPPLEPGTPVGPESICQEETSDYTSTGSDDADSYEWEISPEEAGTITANGLDATVEWNAEFNGVAMISLYGINDCGEGSSSEALEVSVGAPNPQIEGETLVCDWSEENYQVTDNEGSTYTWEITGGSIVEGQDTFMITVSWDGEGSGTVLVNEETVDGCEGSSEVFEVTIDDCTGIDESSENDFKVYPNPVTNMLSIEFSIATGTNARIDVYNHLGQLMTTKVVGDVSTHQKIQFNMADFPVGVYLIKMSNENELLLNRKVIKR